MSKLPSVLPLNLSLIRFAIRTLKVTTLLALSSVFSVTYAEVATTVDLPCRNAKLIVPWAAGGGTDIVFRLIAEEANKLGAKPALQVINMPGQSGNKGTKKTAKEKADGCTLLAIHQSLITSYINGQSDLQPRDFEIVSLLTETPSYIGAQKNAPYSDIAGLKSFASANPNKIISVGSLGSTSHFIMLMIEDQLGVEFRHVSYDGTRERVTALLSGNADIGEVNLSVAQSNIASGDLKVLAYTKTERATELPEVKTLIEQGVNVSYGTERGIALPKGTPENVVRYYDALFAKAMASDTLRASLAAKGVNTFYLSSAEYRTRLDETAKLWTDLAKKVGIYRKD